MDRLWMAIALAAVLSQAAAQYTIECEKEGYQLATFDVATKNFTCTKFEGEGCVDECVWSDGYTETICSAVALNYGWGSTASNMIYVAGLRKLVGLTQTLKQIKCCRSRNRYVSGSTCNIVTKASGSWQLSNHYTTGTVGVKDMLDRTDTGTADFWFEGCQVQTLAATTYCSPCHSYTCLHDGTCGDKLAANTCKFPDTASQDGQNCGAVTCVGGACAGTSFTCTCPDPYEGTICETSKCIADSITAIPGSTIAFASSATYKPHLSALTETCRSGSIFVPASSNLLCSNGTWTGTRVTCTPICPVDANAVCVNDGTVVFTPSPGVDSEVPNAALPGTSMKITCNTDFVVEGASNAVTTPSGGISVCSGSGWSVTFAASGYNKCVPKKCSKAALALSAGVASYTFVSAVSSSVWGAVEGDLVPHGTTAGTVCAATHIIDGDNSFSVCVKGVWMGTQAVCKPRQCFDPYSGAGWTGSPAADANGYYANGAQVGIVCPAGYHDPSSGATKLTCAFGEWTGTEPTCLPDTCSVTPATVLNGVVVYESSGAHASTRHVVCTDGFENFDYPHEVCLFGTWTGTPPSDCEGARCRPHLFHQVGTYIYQDGGANITDDFLNNTATAKLICPSGYTAVPGTDLTCTNGAWTGTRSICEMDDCSAPDPAPTGAVLVYTLIDGSVTGTAPAVFAAGMAVTARCDHTAFYKRVGPTTAMSCIAGEWVGAYNDCEMIGCRRSDLYVHYGSVEFSDSGTDRDAPNGTVAYSICDSGFELEAEIRNMTCVDGTWADAPLTKCTPVTCALDVPDPDNGVGNYTDTMLVGDYVLGTSVERAVFESRWYPTCDEDYERTDGNGTKLCTGGVWVDDGIVPTCEPKKCPPVLWAFNASVNYGAAEIDRNGWFPNGTVASVDCYVGFHTNGSLEFEAECYYGVWINTMTGQPVEDNQLITCEEDWCYAGPNVSFAQRVWSEEPDGLNNYPPRTVITYTCLDGYELADGDLVTAAVCERGTWITEDTTGCSPRGCAEYYVISNGYVEFSPPCINGECAHGTIVYASNYTCENGTHASPDTAECEFGEWVFTNGFAGPECREDWCEAEPNGTYPNGQFSYPFTCDYDIGNNLVEPGCTRLFYCDYGYKWDNGSLYSSVCHYGQWSNDPDPCIPMHCHNDLYSEHANISYPTEYQTEHGGWAYLYCGEGYVAQTSYPTSAYCDHGIWTFGGASNMALCEPASCDPADLEAVINSTTMWISYDRSTVNGLYPHGTSAEPSCPGGWVVSDLVLPYCYYGEWTNYGQDIGICIPQQCRIDLLSVGQNGDAVFEDTPSTSDPWQPSWPADSRTTLWVDHNSNATIACNDGYYPNSPGQVVYCRFGNWTGDLDGCYELSCATLLLDNEVGNGYMYDDLGQRSNFVGNPLPMSPPGAVACAACDYNYQTDPFNRDWDHHYKICIGGEWWGTDMSSHSCVLQYCYDDPIQNAPDNIASISGPPKTMFTPRLGGYPNGTVFYQTCAAGYNDYGNNGYALSCYYGSWRGYGGDGDFNPCIEEDCDSSSYQYLSNGNYRYSDNTWGNSNRKKRSHYYASPGTRIFVECDVGYELSDKNNMNYIYCKAGSWVGPTLPTCVPERCVAHVLSDAVGLDHTVSFTASIDSEGRVPHGTTASLVCDSNYVENYPENRPWCDRGAWNDTVGWCTPKRCSKYDLLDIVSDYKYRSFTLHDEHGSRTEFQHVGIGSPQADVPELGGEPGYPHGTMATLYCENDFWIETERHTSKISCEYGIWQVDAEPLPRCVSVCKDVDCNSGDCLPHWITYDGDLQTSYSTYRGLQTYRTDVHHFFESGDNVPISFLRNDHSTYMCYCPFGYFGQFCEFYCPVASGKRSVPMHQYTCFLDVSEGLTTGLMSYPDALSNHAGAVGEGASEEFWLPVPLNRNDLNALLEFIQEWSYMQINYYWSTPSLADHMTANVKGYGKAQTREVWTGWNLPSDYFCWQAVGPACSAGIDCDRQNPRAASFIGFDETNSDHAHLSYNDTREFLLNDALAKFDCVAVYSDPQSTFNYIVNFVDCDEANYAAVCTSDDSSADQYADNCVKSQNGWCFFLYNRGQKVTWDEGYFGCCYEFSYWFWCADFGIDLNDGNMVADFEYFMNSFDNLGAWARHRLSEHTMCYEDPYAVTLGGNRLEPFEKGTVAGERSLLPIHDGGLSYSPEGVALTVGPNGEWHLVSKLQLRYAIMESTPHPIPTAPAPTAPTK